MSHRYEPLRNALCRLWAGLVCVMCFVALASGTGRAAPQAGTAPVLVNAQEKADVQGVIRELYDAYVKKDLERILSMEKVAIEASAQEYERRGKGKAEEVRQAFRGATQDVLQAAKFGMKPLNLEDLEYRRQGNDIVVSSAVPIIATEKVDIGSEGETRTVRLLMSRFVLRKTGGRYEIVKMQLQ